MVEETKNEVVDEIKAMTNALEGKPEEPVEEEEQEEEEEHPEETDEEEEPEEPKKKDGEGEGKEEEEEEPEELSDEDKKKKEDEALAALTTERAARTKAEEDAKKEEEERKKRDESPLELEDQDFIGDLDLDELIHDKTAFNKLLNAVYSKGVADSKKISTEGVLRAVPDIIKHNIALLSTIKEASDNFYKDNADLTPYKKVVAAVFEEIHAKNPDKKFGEVMELVAPEARKRLNLHKKAVENEKKEKKEERRSPHLPGKKSNQRQTPHKPDTSSLQNEIGEMNKALGR